MGLGDGRCHRGRISLPAVHIPSYPNLSSQTIPHLSLAGRRYVAARTNRARCSLVLEVLVHRRRQRRRNDDDKDGGLRRQTNGDGDGGDHRMQEEGGASQRNTSLGVGHVVGGEDDLRSLSHARHATCFRLRVHLSSQTLPPHPCLLECDTLPQAKTRSRWSHPPASRCSKTRIYILTWEIPRS